MASRPFWSVHNHSQYSVNDALPKVGDLVSSGSQLGYPAMGLVDHGSVAGNLQLYKACRKEGMEPLPGIELYVTPDRETRIQGHNLHLTVNAYSEVGYRNLCKLVTTTARNFHYKPRIDLADLAAMAEDNATQGLTVATGCWFGLLPTVMREQGPDACEHLVKTLASWFPRVYVELQAHGIMPDEQSEDAQWWLSDEFWDPTQGPRPQLGEDDMVEALIGVSERTGIPYIITTDAHYISPADQKTHDGLKKLCSWSDSPDDAVFPGGPYSLMDQQQLKEYFEPDVVERSCEVLSELADVASVRIPAIDNFRMLVPNVARTDDPVKELRELVMDGLERRMGNESKARRDGRLQRVNHELDIIEQAGFSTFILMTASICQWMISQEIVFNARGSVNDSEVCYLAGITNVSAYAWNAYNGLRFERFISVDRIKLPDIDLDIEHTKRDLVVAECARRFTVSQVGTLMRYSLFDETEEGKGSLRVRYYATRNKAGLPKILWRDIPAEDRQMLVDLGKRRLPSGYGTHAAGLILAPNEATLADLPMTRVGTGKKAHFVTSYDKNDVEDLGFVKGDFLGLRFLSAIASCARLIMAETGEQLTPMEFVTKLPLNEARVYARMSRGNTVGIFQLGERAGIDLMRRMKPRNLKDLVASMALGRPAALASGTTSTYLARRKGMEQIPEMHPDLAKESKDTFGVLLYQEQVIGACRAIGMDIIELNTLLKALKASNDYVDAAKVAIEGALPRIRMLAEQRGWGERDVELLVDAVKGYSDYGFNEGHAAGYGLFAYWTGWMAEFHPAKWWASLLDAFIGEDDEPVLVTAARRNDVRVMSAHVNESKESYSYDAKRNAVLRGLRCVKGVGEIGAAELVRNQPYKSLEDLARRVVPKRVTGVKDLALKTPVGHCGGMVSKLFIAGALDGLEWEVPPGGEK